MRVFTIKGKEGQALGPEDPYRLQSSRGSVHGVKGGKSERRGESGKAGAQERQGGDARSGRERMVSGVPGRTPRRRRPRKLGASLGSAQRMVMNLPGDRQMAVACAGIGNGGRGEAELRKALARSSRAGEEGGAWDWGVALL